MEVQPVAREEDMASAAGFAPEAADPVAVELRLVSGDQLPCPLLSAEDTALRLRMHAARAVQVPVTSLTLLNGAEGVLDDTQLSALRGASLTVAVTREPDFFPFTAGPVRERRHWRLNWAVTSTDAPDGKGFHAQFVSGDGLLLDAKQMRADVVTERGRLDGVATGWNKPACELNYGRCGLVGHWWGALQVDSDLGVDDVEIIGVMTDCYHPVTVSCSEDGNVWTCVPIEHCGEPDCELSCAPAGSARLFAEGEVTARHFRFEWATTRRRGGGEQTGFHAQLINSNYDLLTATSMVANIVTARGRQDNCPTGWRKPATSLNFGQCGLVGHYWEALQVDSDFGPGGTVAIGIQADCGTNEVTISCSDDGTEWRVLTLESMPRSI